MTSSICLLGVCMQTHAHTHTQAEISQLYHTYRSTRQPRHHPARGSFPLTATRLTFLWCEQAADERRKALISDSHTMGRTDVNMSDNVETVTTSGVTVLLQEHLSNIWALLDLCARLHTTTNLRFSGTDQRHPELTLPGTQMCLQVSPPTIFDRLQTKDFSF